MSSRLVLVAHLKQLEDSIDGITSYGSLIIHTPKFICKPQWRYVCKMTQVPPPLPPEQTTRELQSPTLEISRRKAIARAGNYRAALAATLAVCEALRDSARNVLACM